MGWHCLDYCVAHPAFTWLWHGAQAVLFTAAASVLPLQTRSSATQSPSQDLFIYTLGLNFSGIQEVQQYGRVGRNGMSPTREMCTASKLFFPYFGNSWGFVLNSFSVQGGEKTSIFKHPGTVRSTWREKGESSVANDIYNIVPAACKNSRSKFCTGARVFVISLHSSTSQVQLPWQKCCVRAEEVCLIVITKELE